MTDFSRPVDHVTVRVPREHAGQRIDAYLPRRFNWRSRQYFMSLLSDGTVRVNGARVKKAFRLRVGDEITLQLPDSYRTQFDYAAIPVSILYEDDALVIVNKPGDLAVQPTGRYIHENLLNRLRFMYREQRGERDVEPCIVHRLDRETSGVIAFAKHRAAARAVTQQFADRRVRKTYLAVVHGQPPEAGTIDAPLRSTSDQHVIVDPHQGKPAVTHFWTEQRLALAALVRLGLETGRQHQLRVHLRHLGHPIIRDELYGRTEDLTRADVPTRQLLHAAELELTHPSGQRLCVAAPLPRDMADFIAQRHPG